jgi:glycosyltransferase involved in cell wall biosynthesis
MKHKPELLLELAQHFGHRNDVMTVVIAQGAGADWLRENKSKAPPNSLVILPFQPYDRHAEILASSDVLITLLDSECGAFSVPSKLLAYMCAQRPVLLAAPPENLASRIVLRADAGVATLANPSDFVEGANQLLNDRPRRTQCSTSARAYAETHFSIDSICEEFLKVIAYAIDGERKAQTNVLTLPMSRTAAPTQIHKKIRGGHSQRFIN